MADLRERLSERLRNLDPTKNLDHLESIPIPEVPGAFTIDGILSDAECEVLLVAVRSLAEGDPRRSSRTAAAAEAEGDDNSIRRRNSQLHTPCHVKPSDISTLVYL